MKIDGGYPVVSVRLEMAFELAYFAPALEIIVGVGVLLYGDDLSELAEKQGKCAFGPYYADGHIVLVQHKNVAIQSGLHLTKNHD